MNNPLKTFCLMACLVAVALALPNKSGRLSNSRKPSQWFSVAELESLPSVDEITYQRLENMAALNGAELVNTIYHLSQINHDLTPSFVPSANSIPAYILKPNGRNVTVNLNQLPSAVQQEPAFGNDQVTIILTGVPQSSRSAKKATHELIQAYMQRNNPKSQAQSKQQLNNNNNAQGYTSSEEDFSRVSPAQRTQTGDLIVIDLAQTLQPYKRVIMLDTEKTGNMIGDILVELANQADVPEEIIHVIGQGPAANVAGAVGRRYQQQTGRSLRRITGLDPARVYAKNPNSLAGLARGNADFVDCIHTSAYGMGTTDRACDVDFYPNGPSVAVPGTDNIVEASMRATRYFAESVRPGNERNFPAVQAKSLNQMNDGNGQRAYMGYGTDYDVEGDYILEINAHSPFGKSAATAQQQNNNHQSNLSLTNGHQHSSELE